MSSHTNYSRPYFVSSDENIIEVGGIEIRNDRGTEDDAHLDIEPWSGMIQGKDGYPTKGYYYTLDSYYIAGGKYKKYFRVSSIEVYGFVI